MTVPAKRAHFTQNMDIELLVSVDSAFYNIVQAASQSHLPFTRYKRKYTLIEFLCLRDKCDCISNGSVSIVYPYTSWIRCRTEVCL